jgi:hypothetical protein
MVTGKKAFEGKSQASLIAAILDAHPPSMATLRPLIPPALTHVVETCLAKDADARWQSAGDLARELRWIVKSTAEPAATKGSGGSRWSRRAVATVLAAFVSGAAVALLTSRTSEPARSPTSVIRTALPLPAGALFTFEATSSLALSPDGKHLAYALARGGPSGI